MYINHYYIVLFALLMNKLCKVPQLKKYKNNTSLLSLSYSKVATLVGINR